MSSHPNLLQLLEMLLLIKCQTNTQEDLTFCCFHFHTQPFPLFHFRGIVVQKVRLKSFWHAAKRFLAFSPQSQEAFNNVARLSLFSLFSLFS